MQRGLRTDVMNQADPSKFASQLESMIEFADAHEEFVLGAWLSQALNRINAITGASQGLSSATE
ncbi:hypothetical protein ASE72_09170 [Sphingomonas sp. Leaf20]|nr:hypothetical protein ASE72_09170 [Sphingomonas sp. Leaf20]